MTRHYKLASIFQDSGFQKYFKNTFWLFFEKFLRLLSGLVVGALVARYLGPENFGLLNYAMSFVALFITFSALGLDSIVVKYLLVEKKNESEIMGTAFILKFMGALGVLLFVWIATILSNNTSELNLIILVIAASALFQSFGAIDFYFQSKVQSKFVVYANIISLIITALLKLYFIYIEASLFYFALAFTLDAVIVGFGLVFFYASTGNRMFQWTYKFEIAKDLLKQSWPLILASMVIMVYMKIDQIMITEMLGASANGNYAAAVRISETWYFIPMVICSSLFPAIVNSKNRNDGSYEIRLQRLFDLMVVIGLTVAIGITFLGKPLILFLFGEAYSDSINVLTVHVWAGVFVSLGVASSMWLVNENLQKLSFYRTAAGAVVNVVLNFLVIPTYGITGAAFTTLISQFVASMFFDVFYKKTRKNFIMKMKSLLLISPIQNLLKLAR
jgi:O-antigen/teichoic acid export membrane protein